MTCVTAAVPRLIGPRWFSMRHSTLPTRGSRRLFSKRTSQRLINSPWTSLTMPTKRCTAAPGTDMTPVARCHAAYANGEWAKWQRRRRLRENSLPDQSQPLPPCSITSSTMARSPGERVRPSVLAVFKFITSSIDWITKRGSIWGFRRSPCEQNQRRRGIAKPSRA